MKIGIDASNIRGGGGIAHLVQLLAAADPVRDGFNDVVIWAPSTTATLIEPRPWLNVQTPPELNRSLPFRLYWQQRKLPRALKAHQCTTLFSPGGTIPITKRCSATTMSRNLLPFQASELQRYKDAAPCPSVSLSQNLLPFMAKESDRYKRYLMYLKLRLVRAAQTKSFSRAEGVIFLTEFARAAVSESVGKFNGRTTIIPHGLDSRFFCEPRPQSPIASFSMKKPFRLLYVSTVDFYKHQWVVAEAVARLRRQGIPVELILVGGSYAPAMRRLRRVTDRLDPTSEFLRYSGVDSFATIHTIYREADAFVFASTCENMPNILLEAMASGLPIVLGMSAKELLAMAPHAGRETALAPAAQSSAVDLEAAGVYTQNGRSVF